MNGVDYTPDIRQRIQLLPPEDIIDLWRNDYKDMQTSMIFGETPSFTELMETIKKLENLFRQSVFQ